MHEINEVILVGLCEAVLHRNGHEPLFFRFVPVEGECDVCVAVKQAKYLLRFDAWLDGV